MGGLRRPRSGPRPLRPGLRVAAGVAGSGPFARRAARARGRKVTPRVPPRLRDGDSGLGVRASGLGVRGPREGGAWNSTGGVRFRTLPRLCLWGVSPLACDGPVGPTRWPATSFVDFETWQEMPGQVTAERREPS